MITPLPAPIASYAARIALCTVGWFWAALSLPTAFSQNLEAPAQGFISIEPYEVRQTFVVRLDALMPDFVAATPEIKAADRELVLQQALTMLEGKCPLTLDGEATPLALAHERSEFIRSDPKLSIVTDDREIIPANEAVMAIVFAASRSGFPRSATVTWDLFPVGTKEVELTFRSPSDKKPFTVSQDQPVATWQVPETESLPQLEKLPLPPAQPRLSIPLLSIVLGIIAAIIALLSKRLGESTPRAFGLLVVGALVAAFACWKIGRLSISHPFEKPPTVTAEQADEITYALLINLYHAFDYREEEAIYDTLAKSVSGDLLERIYLEIHRSLILEDQGGAKVRIKNVDLRRCIPAPLTDDGADPRGFHADSEWVAIGDVTHWAHTHTRLNRYSADLTIAPVNGAWKMTGLEILEEFSEVKKKEESRGQK